MQNSDDGFSCCKVEITEDEADPATLKITAVNSLSTLKQNSERLFGELQVQQTCNIT